MAKTAPQTENFESMENFAALLEESFGTGQSVVGQVIKGAVVSIENDFAIIDVGLKSEGRVPLREFALPGQAAEIKAGDLVDVYVERMEDRNGETVLSHEKAKREASWVELEKASLENRRVDGVITGRVKGGFTVDIGGVISFLPGSQVDVRPIKDVGPLMNIVQPFQILKMDRARGNIVVSRRAILEESRAEARGELVANMSEGMVVDGTVKNITDYGAFVDLGGVDGLLHVTDISWKRVSHPSEALQVGQAIKVQIIRFNKDTQRISLGMKQLEIDPWSDVAAKYPVGARLSGRVTNIADYGAFVELEPGIEGLIHHSEMSWTKKNVPPSKIVSTSQEVNVMVLDVDPSKRRISLGLKQCTENPWEKIKEKFKIGDEVEGEIKNITEFGLFVNIYEDIDGMVHESDLSWEKTGEAALSEHKRGEMLKVRVLDIDAEKERISLGVKQLSKQPESVDALNDLKKGAIVTCEVTGVQDAGLDVLLANGVAGFIKKIDLSRDKAEQRSDRFAVGEKVDAKVMIVDKAKRQATLSIKAREIEEDKEAMAQFGSADSGASLGSILAAAFDKAKATQGEESPAPKKAKTKKD